MRYFIKVKGLLTCIINYHGPWSSALSWIRSITTVAFPKSADINSILLEHFRWNEERRSPESLPHRRAHNSEWGLKVVVSSIFYLARDGIGSQFQCFLRRIHADQKHGLKQSVIVQRVPTTHITNDRHLPISLLKWLTQSYQVSISFLCFF